MDGYNTTSISKMCGIQFGQTISFLQTSQFLQAFQSAKLDGHKMDGGWGNLSKTYTHVVHMYVCNRLFIRISFTYISNIIRI